MAVYSLTPAYEGFASLPEINDLLNPEGFTPYNVWNLFDFFHVVDATTATATEITGRTKVVEPNAFEEHPDVFLTFKIDGSFTYGNLGTVQGSVDRYSVSYNGQELVTVTEISAEASQFWTTLLSANVFDYLGVLFSGDDILYGPDGAAQMYGGPGDDSIYCGTGFNEVFAGAGNDKIVGQTGNHIHGGAGDDIIIFDINGGKIAYGDSGNDTIVRARIQYGGLGDDTLSGGKRANNLNGDDGNDFLFGRSGNDRLNGGQGNDTLNGNSGNDNLNGDSGHDTILGNYGDDTLRGGGGNDMLHGGRGRDILYGEGGDDVVNGGRHEDTLYGSSGASLIGGMHRDRFIFHGLSGDSRILDWGYYGAKGVEHQGEQIVIEEISRFLPVTVTQAGDDTLIEYYIHTITVENSIATEIENFLSLSFF